METYVGTKIVKAKRLTLGEYNFLRGWTIPADEDPNRRGYLIGYPDGHRSWSPKNTFEAAYRINGNFDFGHALLLLKEQKKLSRDGWNGKGMFIVLMPALSLPPFNTQDTERKVNDRTAKWIGKNAPLLCQPYFAMYTAQREWQPGWLASQADMLANDWGTIVDA